jgi:hypothetical protein
LAKACWDVQAKNKYCSTKITKEKVSFVPLKNQDLRQFTCPQDAAKCSKEVEIVVSEESQTYNREQTWNEEVPTLAATNWNCKFRVSKDAAST